MNCEIKNKYVMMNKKTMEIKFFKSLGRIRNYIEELVFSKVWDNDYYTFYEIETGEELGINISLNIDFM